MRVDTDQQAASALSGGFASEMAHETADTATTESRALVVTAPPAAAPAGPVYRQAAFLAQLIATKTHAPQTRERRRAEPGEAVSAYRTAAALSSN
jgi:hypothetical protein